MGCSTSATARRRGHSSPPSPLIVPGPLAGYAVPSPPSAGASGHRRRRLVDGLSRLHQSLSLPRGVAPHLGQTGGVPPRSSPGWQLRGRLRGTRSAPSHEPRTSPTRRRHATGELGSQNLPAIGQFGIDPGGATSGRYSPGYGWEERLRSEPANPRLPRSPTGSVFPPARLRPIQMEPQSSPEAHPRGASLPLPGQRTTLPDRSRDVVALGSPGGISQTFAFVVVSAGDNRCRRRV